MLHKHDHPKKPNSTAGTTLLAVPFVMVGFTAAMIHIPAEAPPARAPQILAERGVERSSASAVSAAADDDMFVLRLLAQCGVDMDGADEAGVTPLIASAQADASHAMHWLLRHQSVELEATDAAGLTATAYAVAAGHVDRVEQLAAAGAHPGARGINGEAPITVAVAAGNPAMVTTLLEHGERTGLSEAVATTIKDDRLDTANFLLTQQTRFAPGEHSAQRASLLHDAVRAAKVETVVLLLDHQAPLDVADADTCTPLGTAVEAGQLELCDLLLKAGSATDSPCVGQSLPLQIAWQKRDLPTAELLLEHGAAPHPAIVAEAAAGGEFGFVRLLARFGAPVDVPLEDGETMLARALSAGDQLRVSELLAIGASPSVMTKEGQAVLAVAIARRDAESTRMLLEAGAEPNIVLEHPVSDAYHELLDSKELSFYLKRDSRFTPLMIAAGTGEGDVIRALLEAGASRSKYTRNYKRYPISFASSAGHILAQQLITGYDPEKRDDHFKITIDLSSQRATLYKNGKAVNSSTVSTGKSGYRTPTGEYVVTHKHRHHNSTLYGSPMPYFMRFSCGSFGTHTGSCPGYPASHGCIRMPNSKAREFFYATPTGTAVSIVP